MKKLYYSFLDNFILRFTYWGWKFIAGSVGAKVERPWTAKICLYFWPVFLASFAPFFAIFFLYASGPLAALVALLLLPPLFSVAALFWILRLIVGPPFLRFIKWFYLTKVEPAFDWLAENKTVQLVWKIFSFTVVALVGFALLAGVIYLIIELIFHLVEQLGIWWAAGVIVGFFVAVAAVLFLGFLAATVGKDFVVEKYQVWAAAHPPREKEKKPTNRPVFLKKIGHFAASAFKVIVMIVLFIPGLIASACHIVYDMARDVCPVLTYEAPVDGKKES